MHGAASYKTKRADQKKGVKSGEPRWGNLTVASHKVFNKKKVRKSSKDNLTIGTVETWETRACGNNTEKKRAFDLLWAWGVQEVVKS